MHASVPANRLTSTPISISNPSTGTPPTPARTCIGASLVSEVLADGAEAEHFGVGAKSEEGAAENRALNHGAWNRLQRIARLGPERGGALESNEAEEREDEPEAEVRCRSCRAAGADSGPSAKPWRASTSATTVRMKKTETASIQSIRRAEIFTSRQAIHIEMPVTISASSDGGRAVAGGVAEQQIGVVIEAADDARRRGNVGEQQAPGGDGAKPRRQDHPSVGVERAGRGRVAREAADAPGHEQESRPSPGRRRARCRCRRERRPAEWWRPASSWAQSWRRTAPASPSGRGRRSASHSRLKAQGHLAARCAPRAMDSHFRGIVST